MSENVRKKNKKNIFGLFYWILVHMLCEIWHLESATLLHIFLYIYENNYFHLQA